MDVKWFALAVVAIFVSLMTAMTIERTNRDPLAQQIESCREACGFKGMNTYDAEKKFCECAK